MTLRAETQVRASTRVVTDIEATCDARGQSGRALVYNISTDGCMIEDLDELAFEKGPLSLSLVDLGRIHGTVVWQNGAYAGIRFLTPLSLATVKAMGFKEPEARFDQRLPRDRFGRMLPILSGRLPF